MIDRKDSKDYDYLARVQLENCQNSEVEGNILATLSLAAAIREQTEVMKKWE